MENIKDTQKPDLSELIEQIGTLVNQIQNQSEIIHEQTEMIKGLKKTIEEKDELINYLNRQLFGRKSEKLVNQAIEADMDPLFDVSAYDLEYPEPDPEAEIKKETITYDRNKRSTSKDKAPDVPVEEILIEASEEEKICPYCGSEMEVIGKELVRSVIVVEPAKVFIRRTYTQTLACPECRKDGDEVLVKTKAPVPLIPHSSASAEAAAHIIQERFVKGVPYYRQEKEWKVLGMPLCRKTMSNWVMQTAENWLKLIVERMRHYLLGTGYVHCDETHIKVMQEADRSNNTKSYMWVYSSIRECETPIRIFQYKPGRKAEFVKDFLSGFKGVIITDGYKAYKNIEGTTQAMCWAHARRYIFDCVPHQTKMDPDLVPVQALKIIQKLFALEKGFASANLEKKKEIRRKESKVVKEYFEYLEEVQKEGGVASKKLNEAIEYSLNHKEELTAFLNDVKIPLTNSLAERTIRPFAVGRKNWLFSGSPKGAESCGIIYSIVESAKANGLSPYKYILHVLKKLPREWSEITDTVLDSFLPWSREIQAACK